MKKIPLFLAFSGVAFLIALCLALGFGLSFWAILIILEIGYGAYLLRPTNPKIAWTIGAVVVIALICGSTYLLFKRNLPLTNASLPWAKNQADVWLTKKGDPGLSMARRELLIELRKKEDALANDIPGLMQSGKYEEMTKRTQELIDLRKDIEKLLAQATSPTEPTKGDTVSYKVNKGEVISTLSVPDNSTVYLEADKAFCLLERYGSKDDGSEKLSTLTLPPGKSNKYFAWGGTLRVVGLYDNTAVKLHL